MAAYPLLGTTIEIAIIFVVLLLVVAYITLLERKFAARLQSRIGPYRVGPRGLLQPIADAVKLLVKEDLVPADADRRVFNLAPIVFLAPCFLIFASIPFAPGLGIADLNIGVLFFLAVSSMEIVGLFMAGWSSNNKYALLSSMRAVNQIISYDLPFIMAALVPVLLAGSLKMSSIVEAQQGLWFVFYPVLGQLGFIFFVVASVAAENRTPFDILEAESELVAGFRVEYSGFKHGDVVPGRAAVPRRVGGPRAGVDGADLVPAQGAPGLPAHHLGAVELHSRARRSDPADLLEGAAARHAAARDGDGRHDRHEGSVRWLRRARGDSSPRPGNSPARWRARCASPPPRSSGSRSRSTTRTRSAPIRIATADCWR
jgi:NADH:ubiquinone oxidoreductase subunit H